MLKSKKGSITIGMTIFISIIIMFLILVYGLANVFIVKQKVGSVAKNLSSSLATNISYEDFVFVPRVSQLSDNNTQLIKEIIKNKDMQVEEIYTSHKDNEFIVEVKVSFKANILKAFTNDDLNIVSNSKFKTFLEDDYWEMYLYELDTLGYDNVDIDFYFKKIKIEEVF